MLQWLWEKIYEKAADHDETAGGKPDRLQIAVRLTPQLLRAINAYRARHLDEPSRPEVIRRALVRFLAEESGNDARVAGGARPRRPAKGREGEQ